MASMACNVVTELCLEPLRTCETAKIQLKEHNYRVLESHRFSKARPLGYDGHEGVHNIEKAVTTHESCAQTSLVGTVLNEELEQIRSKHAVLASTGCTRDFCQSGRAIHTDEPRVGENRLLQVVEQEAIEFLRVLREEGFYKSEDEFQDRLDQVQGEIKAGSVKGVIREDRTCKNLAGTWTQTYQELEFGIRRAWRNARKCIMRSHSDELKLCDLRGITSSVEMITELVKGVSDAFNGGNIQPTVFVFPPRKANTRGPMIWNNQILQFAGYETEVGKVLGDPASVGITNAIIDLGWQPPEKRSRWDLLPLVAMAEGDRPAMIELPEDIRKLVNIRHPRYTAEFERLDLKWVAFPALTRMGFDIGGVQYTAAPFIGWFMDAEIGVRDLADQFRYNVLPDIVEALGLASDKLHDDIEVFDDLPEYEKLSMLSRAQAELNYAVHWSFVQEKVTMTDSLTASMKWCRYDDDFREKNGYRLPADPYWLAPPQGSIIPLWHRGGAPNYQPKPMICKHVQDPIKAWKREKRKEHASTETLKPAVVVNGRTAIAANQGSETEPATQLIRTARRNSLQLFLPSQQHTHELESKIGSLPMNDQIESICRATILQLSQQVREETHEPEHEIERSPMTEQTENKCRRNSLQLFQRIQKEIHTPANDKRCISIFFCSAGTIAEKLALRLHRWLNDFVKPPSSLQLCARCRPLNSLSSSDLTSENIVLLIVSSTGQGEIPVNGLGITKLCENISSRGFMDRSQGFRFAVFGNGDSRYSATYNGAAVKINDLLTQAGGCPIFSGIFQADTAMEPLPLSALKTWWSRLQRSIADQPIESLAMAVGKLPTNDKQAAVVVSVTPIVKLAQKYEDYQDRLFSTLGNASLVDVSPAEHEDKSLLVTICVDKDHFEEMSCIQILPSNALSKVNQALQSLRVKSSDGVDLGLDGGNPTYASFLTDYVDLELPFSDAECLEAVESFSQGDLTKACLERLPVWTVLERLRSFISQMSDGQRCDFVHDMCQDMSLLHTRTYSIASSQHYSSTHHRRNVSAGREVDIMVKVLPFGRFSKTFMQDAATSAPLKYRIVDSPSGAILRQNHTKPFVIVATGAGFGPARSLLQWRIGIIREALAAGRDPFHPSSRGSGISLFLGLKPVDVDLVIDVVNEAMSLNLIDILDIVLSNPSKRRVFDALRRSRRHLRDKLLKREGMAFVCTNRPAAESTKGMLEKMLGGRVGDILGERYVEEVF